MKTSYKLHQPVMPEEVMTYLSVKPSGIYIDATAGFGGHAELIVSKLDQTKGGHLYLVDQDKEALEYVRTKFSHNPVCSIYGGNFRDLTRLVRISAGATSGILFDLGVSSPQLDQTSRGFSFKGAGPLDMRMDQSQNMTAAVIVNTYSELDLARLITDFGQERYAKRIASAIVSHRPIMDTGRLAELIAGVVPTRHGQTHPATRTFQALRIAVNDEFNALGIGLAQAFSLLEAGGRLVVITFHSLEERIVRDFMKSKVRIREAKLVTTKPIEATAAEVSANPRARSARLRTLERVG